MRIKLNIYFLQIATPVVFRQGITTAEPSESTEEIADRLLKELFTK